MVCSANDLLGWKDFPKGLRVLLLVEDSSSASQITSKLEQMDYIVITFYNENEALLAISNNSEEFHIAIVEVSTDNSDGRYKFLENAKDLPTIMTSDMQCLSTMMKCIALGAVEFLEKPLSEEKLRNIWQHVVHKAFNAGGKDQAESPEPMKESLVSMLKSPLENEEPNDQISVKIEHAVQIQENSYQIQENGHELSSASDKYPAPSTPQIKQGVRLVDDGDCQDQTNFSTDKESGDHDGESKSVEITEPESPSRRVEEGVIKDKDELATGSKDESDSSYRNTNRDCGGDGGATTNIASGLHSSSKANRKRMKVDWTPELHKKFVQAVEQLGVDQAIPSRILELMKVEGLTRHNVASHLQKYRMQRRHILPKEEDRRWPNPRDSTQRSSYYPHKPVMAFPPYHSNHPLRAGQLYPSWVPPNGYQSGVQMWAPPYYPSWQPTDSWHWKPYPAMHADAWGCPVMPQPLAPCPPFPQNASMFHGVETMQNTCSLPQHPYDFYPAEEVIDKVVKEAISKPWLPLPLGLKPPSTDSVLTELSKQGISTIPPNTRSTIRR
ncbi:hypothetical protein LguiA_015291 [Lonicera macranthoides]